MILGRPQYVAFHPLHQPELLIHDWVNGFFIFLHFVHKKNHWSVSVVLKPAFGQWVYRIYITCTRFCISFKHLCESDIPTEQMYDCLVSGPCFSAIFTRNRCSVLIIDFLKKCKRKPHSHAFSRNHLQTGTCFHNQAPSQTIFFKQETTCAIKQHGLP